MNMPEDLEAEYRDVCHRLHTAARDAAYAKKWLIERWMLLHYPAIPCVVTIMQDNMLSLDVCFPGTDQETSTRLAHEVNEYLESLLR